MKPYHGRPYPILHKHKAILMKEIKWLCNIGVLEWQPSSGWVLLTFIILKKDSTMGTISEFRKFNKRIVRKPNSISKISTILQELEGFIYATALDFNMGYYGAYGYFVLLAVCSAICSAKFGFFYQAEHIRLIEYGYSAPPY